MNSETNNQQDVRVEELWKTLDIDQNGRIDAKGLKRGLKKLDHPLQNADSFLDTVMKAVDTNRDGQIEYHEFLIFVKQTERELWTLFKSIDRDRNGKLDKQELWTAFNKAGCEVPRSKLDRFFDQVDTNHDGVISFEEWRDFLLFIPAKEATLQQVMSYFTSTVKLTSDSDVQISDEGIDRLGTLISFLAYALFGSLINIAYQKPYRPPSYSIYHPSISHAQPSRAPVTLAETDLPSQTQSQSQSSPSKAFLPQGLPPPSQAMQAKSKSSLQQETSEVATELTHRNVLTMAWYDTILPVLIAMVPTPGYFLAGGLAGIVSRTATAPLDRLKVYLIAQTSVAKEAVKAAKSGNAVGALRGAVKPLSNAMKDLWAAGGIRSLYAGNGLNVVKVMPESAIKFGSYEATKRVLARLEGHGDPAKLQPWSQFSAGGVAGMISQFFVYPIDTLKFRMQCETVSGGLRGNKLIVETAKKMWVQDGFRSFFRGLNMGLVGMFPYAAIDLTTFEYLKRTLVRRNARLRRQREAKSANLSGKGQGAEDDSSHRHEDDLSGMTTAAIGGFSGAFGASLVYPLNLLRTRLQSQGTVLHPQTYTGVMDVTRKTIKGEGFRGLFRGLTPNLLKVVPAVSITYVVYEKSKRLMALK